MGKKPDAPKGPMPIVDTNVMITSNLPLKNGKTKKR